MQRMLHRGEECSPCGLETLFCILRVSPKTLVIAVHFLDPCSYFETGGKCSWSHWVLLSAGTSCMCDLQQWRIHACKKKAADLGSTLPWGLSVYTRNNRSWRNNWIWAFGGILSRFFLTVEVPVLTGCRVPGSWVSVAIVVEMLLEIGRE